MMLFITTWMRSRQRHWRGDLGSLLCRVEYADGTINKLFEGNSGNLVQLLRIWTAALVGWHL